VSAESVEDEPLSATERSVLTEAGLAVFAGRVVLEAQPGIDDATLAAVAERCAGPLPVPLVALWRTTFGGRLDYDLRADLDGHDVTLSFTELFYPDSGDYHDLWGWIEHEHALAQEHLPGWSGRLEHLPIGGFEYLDRLYVRTPAGPDHGVVVGWQQGLPPIWELLIGDRGGRVASDLEAAFGLLTLEQDPWAAEDPDAGEELREAIDALAESENPAARSAAGKLRRLVRAVVLDWRGAVERGTLASDRRLRRLALERAAADGDVDMLQRLVALGCDPAEEVRNGLAPIDVAIRQQAGDAVRWLLDRGVPVRRALRSGAHNVDLALARELTERGATVDTCAVMLAVQNQDVDVSLFLANQIAPDQTLAPLASRLRMDAAQATIAADRARNRADQATAARQQHRATVLRELADRFDGYH
jgi:hypothetical protein